ncbi:MAG: BMFP domain-containing protein YqiC [Parasphingorhabdus sp.]
MSIKNIADVVNSVLPDRLGEDLRTNVKAMVRSTFENMELVSREELEVQEKVLLRTRQKLQSLEARIAELEVKINQVAD